MSRGNSQRPSVAVLMGGWSAEREVSLKTGRAALAAVARLGHPCWAVDAGHDLPAALSARRPDVAFIALHGRGGEDGAVQGLMEVMEIPYTGSGVLASALAMNKKFSKWIFEGRGLATPPWTAAAAGKVIRAGDLPFGLPAVVKPVAEGSTIGVGIVRREKDLAAALETACRYGSEALIEKYIAGREMTVGVIGHRVLSAVEIIPEDGFYDYEAKYRSSRTRYVAPAEISPTLAGKLSTISLAAAEALGCRGQARVDFRVDSDETPYLLEVNTIPGMTETSLLPKSAAAAGLGFDDLVAEIIRLAMEER